MPDFTTTRYYVQNNSGYTGYPPGAVAWLNDWDRLPISVSQTNDELSRHLMKTTPLPSASYLSSDLAQRPAVRPGDSAALQMIFPPFKEKQSFDGAFFRMVFGATYIGDASIKVIFRLIGKNGVDKARLGTFNSARVFDGNTFYSRTIEGSISSEVTAEVGDYVVVDGGFDFVSGLGGSAAICGYPQTTAQDLPYSDGVLIETRSQDPNKYRGWVELSFKAPVKRLSWSPLKARYEHGIDQGVFYPEDGPGVAWNGLVSVEDSYVGGEIEPLYLDGVLFHNMPSGRHYQATITAFSAPPEFAPSNGELAVEPGLILTRQPRKRFGFSYRVMVGEDLGYKIHLVYNATATPTSRGYKTRTDSPSPSNPVWQIDAVPVESDAPRPTAHFVLDSTKIGKDPMEAIEGLLYGAKTRSPYLPSIGQITAIVNQWDPKIVMPSYTDGLSPLVDGMGDVVESDVDGVYISLPNGRMTETSVRGLYQLTE